MLSDEEYLKEAKEFFARGNDALENSLSSTLAVLESDTKCVRKTYPVGYIVLPDGRTIRQDDNGEPYFAGD